MPRALDYDAPASLTATEVERLAEVEHERWMSERIAEGWTEGPRDDEARTHPSVVPWDLRSEPEKERTAKSSAPSRSSSPPPASRSPEMPEAPR